MRFGNDDVLGTAIKTNAIDEHEKKIKKKFKEINQKHMEEFLLGFIIFLFGNGVYLSSSKNNALTNDETTRLRKDFVCRLKK